MNSKIATNFRRWATERLKEYLIKGYTMDDDNLALLEAVGSVLFVRGRAAEEVQGDQPEEVKDEAEGGGGLRKQTGKLIERMVGEILDKLTVNKISKDGVVIRSIFISSRRMNMI